MTILDKFTKQSKIYNDAKYSQLGDTQKALELCALIAFKMQNKNLGV